MIPGSIPCSVCGHENPAGNRFCGSCGGPLQPVAAVSPDAVDPGEDRRLVTILFCDLVGFTSLSERLDAEQVRDIQDAYFAAMSAEILRYGGTVEKYAGDAVLAIFGVPVVHEDDSERAVLCALAMPRALEPVAADVRARHNVPLTVRVGVNTGEVVSGLRDAAGRRDFAVTGDAVNVAARLQAAAEPGGVIVGQETMRLAERAIVFGNRVELTLKGKAEPVPAYPPLRLRAQATERWETTPRRTPLVGRTAELALLRMSWEKAVSGKGQLVTIHGEAGVGKSRLVAEALDQVATGRQVLRARCHSYAEHVSLSLVADLVRSLCRIEEEHDSRQMETAVAETVADLLVATDKETRRAGIDVLREALGVLPSASIVSAAGPQVRRQVLIRSVGLLLQAACEREPVVVVLEDLHWIDLASREVVEEVLRTTPALKLLAIVTARPGWKAPWGHLDWPVHVDLNPLPERDSALLVEQVLGQQASAELAQRIGERAEGNPFFVEELLHQLQDTGDLTVEDNMVSLVPEAAERLPWSLTEVLLARLDRLDREVRGLAQVGSAIGRTFALRLIARVVDRETTALEAPLTALEQAALAFRHVTPEVEYIFKHATVREVAYNTILKRRREDLHGSIARAIIALYPADENVETVAYHYARTTDHVAAALWLERAGDRAADVYANENAIAHYEAARERLQLGDAAETALARIDTKVGPILKVVGRYDDALATLQRAAGVYRETGDSEGEVLAMAYLGLTYSVLGRPAEGIALLESQARSREGCAPTRGLAVLHNALAQLYFGAVGQSSQFLHAAERAGEIARAVDDVAELVTAEAWRGTALLELGEIDEGLEVLESVKSQAEGVGNLEALSRAYLNIGAVAASRGQMQKATQSTERALELTERTANPLRVTVHLSNLANCMFVLGDWHQARAYLERALETVRPISSSFVYFSPLFEMGSLALAEGDWEEASSYLEQATAAAKDVFGAERYRSGQEALARLELRRGLLSEALERLLALPAGETSSTLAEVYFELGKDADAENVLHEGLPKARADVPGVLDWLRVLGMLRARQGRYAEATDAFEEGLNLARAIPYPYAEAHLLHAYGHAAAAAVEDDHGQKRLEAAREIFMRLGATKDVERTERALAALHSRG